MEGAHHMQVRDSGVTQSGFIQKKREKKEEKIHHTFIVQHFGYKSLQIN